MEKYAFDISEYVRKAFKKADKEQALNTYDFSICFWK